jgi:hypothetical protein
MTVFGWWLVEEKFTYAAAEQVLAKLYGLNEGVQKGPFRGRLKHLKRLGIPLGVNPGRGKKVLYSRDHIYEWAFCLELSQFGIDPTLITGVVRQHWEKIILPAIKKISIKEGSPDKYFFAYASYLTSSLSEDREEFSALSHFGWIDEERLGSLAFSLAVSNRPRGCFIFNVRHLLKDIDTAISSLERK